MNNMVVYLCCLVITGVTLQSTIHAKDIDRSKKSGNTVQITDPPAQFDLQQNAISRVQFFTTNYGIFGLNVRGNVGGGFWPRGSGNQYIFGGGVWFAGKKRQEDGSLREMCVISYNPNSGSSWLVPGRITDGDPILSTQDAINKYKTYIASDYKTDGTPVQSTRVPNWPIWDTAPITDTLAYRRRGDIKADRYFGQYIDSVDKRSSQFMPLLTPESAGRRKGPVFVSQEDIFTTFKDTDLNRYEITPAVARSYGYPMRLQFEQTTYTWGFGEYANFIFLKYSIINQSTDTLRECWMAPAYDFDLAPSFNSQGGAQNDDVRYYSEDTTLNMAVQWTLANQGERGRNFGYIGMDFLESPAISTDTNDAGFIRKDKKYYENNEQLGLVTFRNWVIADDPTTDVARYKFISRPGKDAQSQPGDKRFLMGTGPFSARPGDTARVVIGMIFANTSKGGEADGTVDDMQDLVNRDKFAQNVYDNQFATPRPPDPSTLTWQPLNNAVIVTWNDNAESSFDDKEDGLDFMGYRLYRSRDVVLDSFKLDAERATASYPGGRGPLGWKEVASWTIGRPFSTFRLADSTNINSAIVPYMQFRVRNTNNALVPLRQVATSVLASRYPSFVIQDTNFLPVIRVQSNFTGPGFFGQFWDSLRVVNREYADRLIMGYFEVANPAAFRQRFPNGWTSAFAIANDTLLTAELYKEVGKSLRLTWLIDYGADTNIVAELKRITARVTNNRKFIDFGDDNKNGFVDETDNILSTERLINNVDYFYKIIGFDEGDYIIKTPSKLGTGVQGVNQQQTYPLASGVVKQDGRLQNIVYDSSRIGGIHNFRLNILDQQRFNQLYGGHRMKLVFGRNSFGSTGWNAIDTMLGTASTPIDKAILGSFCVLVDETTNEILEDNLFVGYNPVDCDFGARPSEFSAITADAPFRISVSELSDTNLFASPYNLSRTDRLGSFVSNLRCSNVESSINGTFGIAFDYKYSQGGGYFRPLRPDSVTSSLVNTLMYAIANNPNRGNGPRLAGTLTTRDPLTGALTFRQQTYNVGGGDYEVVFTPGGTEQITTASALKGSPVTFNVPYLTMNIRNKRSITLPATAGEEVRRYKDGVITENVQSLPVKRLVVSAGRLDSVTTTYPVPELVNHNEFNLSAYGWINRRGASVINRPRTAANNGSGQPVGQQNRYYLSAVSADNADTLEFNHALLIDGCTYGLDYIGSGSRGGNAALNIQTPPVAYRGGSSDFKTGDTLRFTTQGSAYGLPLDSATIEFTITPTDVDTNASGQQQYADSELEQVLVVPNPYLVTHAAQRSNLDARIFFTKLPKECTISIYTVNGELVRTIRHTDQEQTQTQGMNVWDLLSNNNQRAASQAFVAYIQTPNGAKTIKKFSIITGGSRQIR